jgi:tetratricopeptide (TPR) repeat protein
VTEPPTPAEDGDDAREYAGDDARGNPRDDARDDPRDHLDPRESVYELLQRGQALARRRHYAQAAIVLGRAARLEPGKGSILEALGRALYNSGQHDQAREAFEALLEVDPSSHYGHYALGQALK